MRASIICLVAAVLSIPSVAMAAGVYWDADDAAGLQSGNGNWEQDGATNWSPTSAGAVPRLAWTSGTDTAWFTISGGSLVTVTGPVTAGAVQVTAPDFSFDGPGQVFIGNGGYNATSYVSVLHPIELTTDQAWTMTGGGYMDVYNVTTVGTHRLTVDGEGTLYLNEVAGSTGGITVNGRGTLAVTGWLRFDGDLFLRNGTTLLQQPYNESNFNGRVMLERGALLRLTAAHVFNYLASEGAPLSISNGQVRLEGVNQGNTCDNDFKSVLLQTALVDIVFSEMRLRAPELTAKPSQVFNVLRAQDHYSSYVLFTNLVVDCAPGGTTPGLLMQGGIQERDGSFGLTKVGAGSLRLNGINSFTQPLVISNGLAQLLTGMEAGTNAIVLAGGTLELTTAGLWESFLSGWHNTFASPSPMRAQYGTPKAHSPDRIAFRDLATWVYHGNLRLTNAVTWTFGEGFDESVLITIDGTNVLEDLTYDVPSIAQVGMAAGLHTIEIRLGQNSETVGPNGIDGWTLIGVGVDVQGRNLVNGTNFTALLDAGDGARLDRGTVVLTNVIVLTAPSSLKLTGSGRVEGVGELQLGSSLTITGEGACAWYGGIAGPGAITKSGAGSFHLHGPLAHTNTTSILAGSMHVNGLHDPNGGYLVSGGTLSGTGTINGPVQADSGLVLPGEGGAGALTVSSYTQTAATLGFQLMGTNSTEYGRLVSAGLVQLGGTLRAMVTNEYVPALGDSFLLVSGASVANVLVATNLTALAPGLAWQVDTMSTAIVLRVIAGPAGYDLYAQQITNDSLRSYADDPDGDGYPNLLEYATGGNPTNVDAIARMSAARTNGVLYLRFTRATNALDTVLVVEAAASVTNGSIWSGLATNTSGIWAGPAAVSEGGTDPRSVSVQDTVSTSSNRFMRLRVMRP